MGVDCIPKVSNDAESHIGHEIGLRVLCQAFYNCYPHEGQGNDFQHGNVFLDKDIVEHWLSEIGQCNGRCGKNTHADHRHE